VECSIDIGLFEERGNQNEHVVESAVSSGRRFLGFGRCWPTIASSNVWRGAVIEIRHNKWGRAGCIRNGRLGGRYRNDWRERILGIFEGEFHKWMGHRLARL
jgi:hypothetical protein